MINIDIIIPICGYHGGVETVLNSWNNHIDRSKYNLRFLIFNGYNNYFDYKDNVYMINSNLQILDCEGMKINYRELVKKIGAPDICVAAIWPFVSKACKEVVDELNLNCKVVSWIHNDIDEFNEGEVLGTIDDLLWADSHLCINKKLVSGLLQLNADAVTYYIGNPVASKKNNLYIPQVNTLAFVGRLQRLKRIDTVLKAVASADSFWKLKIVGDGDDMPLVNELIYSFSLEDRVTLLGWQKEPYSQLLDTQFLVSASEKEGFPLSIIEGLSMGMNVISTPHAGALDIVLPGVNGYFFNIGDYLELANTLDRIDSGELRVYDQEECRRSISDYLSENYYAKLEQIFEDIIK